MTEPTPSPDSPKLNGPGVDLPRLDRLRKRVQFLAAAQGPSCARGSVMIQQLPQPGRPQIGVGFTATKKIGGAVERNRAKRRLRAAAAALLPLYGRVGNDYVLVARIATLTRPFDGLLDDLKAALSAAHARAAGETKAKA